VTLSNILYVALATMADKIRASKTERTLGIDILSSIELALGDHRYSMATVATDTGSGPCVYFQVTEPEAGCQRGQKDRSSMRMNSEQFLDQRCAYRE